MNVYLLVPSDKVCWTLSVRHLAAIEDLSTLLQTLHPVVDATLFLLERSSQLFHSPSDRLLEAFCAKLSLLEVELSRTDLTPLEILCHSDLPTTIVSIPSFEVLQSAGGPPEAGDGFDDFYADAEAFQRLLDTCASASETARVSAPASLGVLRDLLQAYDAGLRSKEAAGARKLAYEALLYASKLQRLCDSFRKVGMALQLAYHLDNDARLVNYAVPHLYRNQLAWNPDRLRRQFVDVVGSGERDQDGDDDEDDYEDDDSKKEPSAESAGGVASEKKMRVE